ncbi:uncharacterized protein C1orf226 homolog [Chanos chanos]|uniref:Uncharacterized protein C1orf226 homolog n=1 Tax=Chanos chanos TaxID=29144 RepID=A0A6J2WN59_CHACN|nr:uncharacterized protein C1orf226 homolog [Chanos chanos]
MFENSNVAEQPRQNSRQGPSSARRSMGSASTPGSTADPSAQKTGSSQHLKNLGKAVGAKVNDLLRRKDASLLGDIGVTEVNKNVESVWSSMADMVNSGAANSHVSLDSFPRLDPPPPSKKRLPRALKTTQDMMISSDPVVATPEVPDSSFQYSPEKAPLVQKDRVQEQSSEEGPDSQEKSTGQSDSADLHISDHTNPKGEEPGVKSTNLNVVASEGPMEQDEGKDGDEDQSQILLSVPDLIHKDNLDNKAKLETRVTSTPCVGNGGCRVSEGELLENGSVDYSKRTSNMENEEPHPDLLSFE